MTNFTLTADITNTIMDAYDAGNGGYYGHNDVAGFWNYCADGFTGSVDDLIAMVVSDMHANT